MKGGILPFCSCSHHIIWCVFSSGAAVTMFERLSHFYTALNRPHMEREGLVKQQNISEHVWEDVCFLGPICCHMCPAMQGVPQRVLGQPYTPLSALWKKQKQGQKAWKRQPLVCVHCLDVWVSPCMYLFRNTCLLLQISKLSPYFSYRFTGTGNIDVICAIRLYFLIVRHVFWQSGKVYKVGD